MSEFLKTNRLTQYITALRETDDVDEAAMLYLKTRRYIRGERQSRMRRRRNQVFRWSVRRNIPRL